MALELTEEQVKAGWTVVSLADCFQIIGGGTPRTSVEEYWNGDIPWLSVTDFSGDRRYVSDAEKKITESGLKNSSTRLLEKGDLIISARGTVGEIAQLKTPMAFNQSCYGLRGVDGIILNSYGYYLLRTVVDKLRKQSYGSVFSTITRKTFDSVKVAIPPLNHQEHVSDFLGSLDDKIDANNAIIDSLSELAIAEIERLGIFSDKADGVLEDIIEFSPRVSKPAGDSYQFVDMSVLPTSGPVAGQTQVKDKWTGSKFVEGDTLFSRITPCLENGKTAIAMGLGSEPAVGSTEFIVMRARGLDRELLAYGVARSRRFREIATQKMTGTSGRQRVKWQDLAVIPVSTTRLNEFSLGSAEFDLLRSLRQENIDLANARNLSIRNLIG